MKKTFSGRAAPSFYNGIKTISVEHDFAQPLSLGAGYLDRQIAGIDDIFKLSGIAIELPDSYDDVTLHIVLKNNYLGFEVRELGTSKPIQTSEVAFSSFSPKIMKELEYATHEDISSGRKENLHWNIANEFISSMKTESFVFRDETLAHDALQKLVAVWYEEEIISKPESKQTYTRELGLR